MEREVSCDEDFGLSEDDEVGDEEEVRTGEVLNLCTPWLEASR